MPVLFSSGPINAILASVDVLVAQQLRRSRKKTRESAVLVRCPMKKAENCTSKTTAQKQLLKRFLHHILKDLPICLPNPRLRTGLLITGTFINRARCSI